MGTVGTGVLTGTTLVAAASSSPRYASDLEQARPQTSGEEELQLQLALAMSREEAEKVRPGSGQDACGGRKGLWYSPASTWALHPGPETHSSSQDSRGHADVPDLSLLWTPTFGVLRQGSEEGVCSWGVCGAP